MSGHPRTHVRPGQPQHTDTPGQDGGQTSGQCPPWCTVHPIGRATREDDCFHEGPDIVLNAPGDHFWQDGPYEVLRANISSEDDEETQGPGRPYICFDTLDVGQAARLDVAAADAVIADLRQYADRLEQMRNRLAEILKEQP
ncbi:DUF6907 domain-containing protein [Streptomyces ardesiacus]